MNLFQKFYRNRQIKKLAHYNKMIKYYSAQVSSFQKNIEQYQKRLNSYQENSSTYEKTYDIKYIDTISKALIDEIEKVQNKLNSSSAEIEYFETLKTYLLKQMDM